MRANEGHEFEFRVVEEQGDLIVPIVPYSLTEFLTNVPGPIGVNNDMLNRLPLDFYTIPYSEQTSEGECI